MTRTCSSTPWSPPPGSFPAGPYEEAVGSSVGSDCRLGGAGSGWPRMEALLCGHHPQRLPGVLPGGKRGHPAGVHPGGLRGLHRRGRRHAVLHRHAGHEAPGALRLGRGRPGARPADCLQRAGLGRHLCGPAEKLTFTNDGIDLDGWVLRPKDFDPQKAYPAILDIHGGPKTVYGEVVLPRDAVLGQPGAGLCSSAIPGAGTAGATSLPTCGAITAPSITATSWPLPTKCWRNTPR